MTPLNNLYWEVMMIGVELAQYLPNITISAWWYDTVTCQIEHNTLESNDSVNSPRIN